MQRIAFALDQRISTKFITFSIITLKLGLLSILLWRIFSNPNAFSLHTVSPQLLWFIGIGFVAQLVDGALGMAYGATCTSSLLWLGIPPAFATASVHTAEVFTTGASGLSHLYFGNIDKKLFFRIVVTGVLGAMLGAYLIADVIDTTTIKPYISGYMIILGSVIISKAFLKKPSMPQNKNLGLLGFCGGFLDAIGGGGWGPLVTSNLIQKGNAPKEAIGTVNTAEFFVAFFSTGIFMIFIDIQAWQPILGLIIGGILAAPLGAFLVRFMQPKTIMISVGAIVVLLSLRNLLPLL